MGGAPSPAGDLARLLRRHRRKAPAFFPFSWLLGGFVHSFALTGLGPSVIRVLHMEPDSVPPADLERARVWVYPSGSREPYRAFPVLPYAGVRRARSCSPSPTAPTRTPTYRRAA